MPCILFGFFGFSAYLASPEGPNVIIVNWGRLARPSWIPRDVSSRVDIVGRRVGDFLNWFLAAASLDPRKVHLVGHSARMSYRGAGREFRGDRVKVRKNLRLACDHSLMKLLKMESQNNHVLL